MIVFSVIVYGDPQFEISAVELLEALRKLGNSIQEDDVDALRALLIQAGQFEQAIEDSPIHHTSAAPARKITDLAATAFHAAWAQGRAMDVRKPLQELRNSLRNGLGFSNERLKVKIPEGFEFYALYPEQYCFSALSWNSHHSGSNSNRAVLVIGIRSIGTSLSALVAATLKAVGWQPTRITVRPTGPPFDRIVTLPNSVRGCARHALVVDEGPGISGSSMAAVAKALAELGFESTQISFFPGHAGEPGTGVSAEVRGWWNKVRRHVTPFEKLRWNGLTLAESLQKKPCELAGGNVLSTRIEDISCGCWREKVYRSESDWPWVAIPFEQMKFRCSTANGDSFFWKFSGLGALYPKANFSSHCSRLANEGWTPKPLARLHGFTATPWIAGKLLSIADGENPTVLQHIGRYISGACKSPLTKADLASAQERLCEMLYWNTKEALGGELAERTLNFSKKIQVPDSCPTYGDGRMAPHEWMRTPDGKILKLDAEGHDMDHTCIGSQPVYWDIAGTMVEWRLRSSGPLLSALTESGVQLQPDCLKFFQMAYAAFRMGQTSLCTDSHDGAEKMRLRGAFGGYREYLRELLR